MHTRETVRRVGRVALACALTGGLGCAPVGEDDALEETELAHHAWLGYHWAGAAPVRVTYVDDLAAKRSSWREHLMPAAEGWARPGLQTALIPAPKRGKSTCAVRDGQIEICTVAARGAAWLAMTSVWTAPGSTEILRAQIQLNDAYVRDLDAREQRRVVCHEMGHAIGLGHMTDTTSCMSESTSADPTPNAHDLELVDQTYPAPPGLQPTIAAVTVDDDDDDRTHESHALTVAQESNGQRRFTWTTRAPLRTRLAAPTR